MSRLDTGIEPRREPGMLMSKDDLNQLLSD